MIIETQTMLESCYFFLLQESGLKLILEQTQQKLHCVVIKIQLICRSLSRNNDDILLLLARWTFFACVKWSILLHLNTWNGRLNVLRALAQQTSLGYLIWWPESSSSSWSPSPREAVSVCLLIEFRRWYCRARTCSNFISPSPSRLRQQSSQEMDLFWVA